MNRKKTIILMLIIVVSFIIAYAGHFLFEGNGKRPESTKESSPVRYKHISTEINGKKQEINILEVDLKDKRTEIKPVLSFDSIFGFEKLSSMAERSRAYAAINAGFFYEFGQPSGMVAIDGRIITASTGKFPVFIFDGQKAYIKQVETKLRLSCGGKRINLNSINTEGKPGETILYTREYGTDNRARLANTSVVIIDNKIQKAVSCRGKTDIPKNGLLLTVYKSSSLNLNDLGIKVNDTVKFEYEPYLGEDIQAYECGSWLVKNGSVVIGEKDEWVGVMTNNDPRTAIGIKDDGKVVLITVDGRQPGYSIGVTGKELGKFLLDYGVIDAAMLDGGASTEMIVKGKIVNKPSFKGQERKLGGAVVVKLR